MIAAQPVSATRVRTMVARMAEIKTFVDLIEDYMRRHSLSNNEFGRMIGLSSGGISNILNGHNRPGLETLISASKVMGVGLTTLIALAYPEFASDLQRDSGLNANSRLMAELIEGLPDTDAALIRDLIMERARRTQPKDDE